ncbi:50S ribosomal protein L14 [Candidatus Dojkabacteria bacterium]|uniref:Large ribosomal subunit protein uL14 n=1 Tax=Candidatus Dojkabacteria bacterium TaxID=2099670 RepID=A0A3M0YZX1_9BACT|nr:MAG: 50S ribosomal protein L14 [Candidatus Dojkabacteria bacterium]
MVQKLTKLKCADNSGAKELLVIQVLGSAKGRMFSKFGYIGDIVSCSVKEALPDSQLKRGDVVHAVIVRTKKEMRRRDGTYIKFDENAAVIIMGKSSKEPKGTRVFGPIGREVKDRGFAKIASLASEVL